ncbi:MAG: hypothetical protein ACD_80C00151G0019 [uncultured bacterium (gcode 4)]|uniref:Uncharacterized protein n=1 Tax=uncultured bacterium (gcode 4) TaxID=1234023 RepID=K1YHF1_9BACT|nr:MAG: hypothetical protein ACD_80C00151G0019 [uncultured bacterium (gcode 4)]
MNILFNDFKKQYQAIKPEIDQAIQRVLDSGWYILGKEVEQFEQEFAKKHGAKYAIGVGNGLDAIKISLLALWVWQWDEVITTSHSAVATTLAILDVGALPVFVDIDAYYHMDANKIEEKITSKTKAILPVHLYGQACEITKMQEICKKHDLFLIEDCAQSHFTKYDGQFVWNFWQVGCFSFYPTKNLWAYGDAGAIITNDEELYKKCKMIRNYGQENRYEHKIYGINSRLDEIQAAILQVQLKHIDQGTQRRSEIAQKYRDWLSVLPQISLPKIKEHCVHTYHLFVIEIDERDALMAYLKGKWIPSLIHYPLSIHKQPFLEWKYAEATLPVLDQKVKNILSLPIHPLLTDEEIEYIISTIKMFYNEK